jgi:type II secretory pathway predicted ATPase ExeA/outer membrane protein OmpA-like peptidoglycan-associated protein
MLAGAENRRLMYLSHYNLKAKPFQLSPDPKFLWLGEQHKEAFAALEYGIRTSKGFILLSGDVGTGKTTLINAIIRRWKDSSVIASVSDPQMEIIDFYNFLAHSFKMDRKFASKGDFLVKFSHLLFSIYKNNKKLLLIIDEAQRLNHKLLEEIRHLSNIELENSKLLSIILAGQNELNDILRQDINRAIRQRIAINYHLKPLSKKETKDYLRHRLKIAGTERKIFTADALPEIMSFSKGYPRLINGICDHSLLTGYVKGVHQIDANIIKECSKELLLPSEGKQEPEQIFKRLTNKKINRIWYDNKSTIGSVLASVVLLLLFGYFLHSRGYISIINKTAKTDATPLIVQAQRDRGQRTEDGRQTTKDGAKRGVIEPIRLPLSEDKKLIIYFDFDSTQLSSDAFEKLEQLAATLLKRPEIRIIIKGFTDGAGIYSYNKLLSEYRANVVKSYLIGKRIEPSRIKTIGIGPAQSKTANTSAKLNRRVEIELHRKVLTETGGGK